MVHTTVPTGRAVLWAGVTLGLLGPSVGCQPSTAVVSRRLVAHMALIDFSGLAPARPVDGGVDVAAQVPRSWELLPVQRGGLFTHRQWRSPSHATGVGVVHVHMPLPMSAKTLVWLGKTQYNAAAPPGKGAADAGTDAARPAATGDAKSDAKSRVPGGPGRLLREWSDPVGREWVEAENDRFHVRGYVITSGFDAWVVYAGYRRRGVPDTVDIDLAYRSLESVIPAPLAPKPAAATEP